MFQSRIIEKTATEQAQADSPVLNGTLNASGSRTFILERIKEVDAGQGADLSPLQLAFKATLLDTARSVGSIIIGFHVVSDSVVQKLPSNLEPFDGPGGTSLLFAQNWSVTAIDKEYVEITVTYDADLNLSKTRPPDERDLGDIFNTDELSIIYSTSAFTETVQIPQFFGAEELALAPDGTASESDNSFIWDESSLTLTVSKMQYTMRLKMKVTPPDSIQSVIFNTTNMVAQHNKLHKIGGRWMLFTIGPGSYSTLPDGGTGKVDFTQTYTYTYDPGIPINAPQFDDTIYEIDTTRNILKTKTIDRDNAHILPAVKIAPALSETIDPNDPDEDTQAKANERRYLKPPYGFAAVATRLSSLAGASVAPTPAFFSVLNHKPNELGFQDLPAPGGTIS